MWYYYYLEDTLHLPFQGKCIAPRPISPLRKGQEVEVTDLAPESECQHEMFVIVNREDRKLAVLLAQLELTQTERVTREAIKDWHYLVERGYEF